MIDGIPAPGPSIFTKRTLLATMPKAYQLCAERLALSIQGRKELGKLLGFRYGKRIHIPGIHKHHDFLVLYIRILSSRIFIDIS